MRCCSTWNLPIGTPNCLRVLMYSKVAALIALHATDGLGAERHDGAVDRVLDHRERAVDAAQHRIGADRDLVEGEFRGTQRVLASGSRGA